LINTTATLAGGEAKERGVDLKVESITDLTLTGVQAEALREALSNLVLNAVQATDPGGEVQVQSSVQMAAAGARVRPPDQTAVVTLTLAVTDSGPGIPADVQQRVFEPFYSTKSRGTGLGLAIVQRRIVEIGGSVELTSPIDNGHGTRFRLTVPLATVGEEIR